MEPILIGFAGTTFRGFYVETESRHSPSDVRGSYIWDSVTWKKLLLRINKKETLLDLRENIRDLVEIFEQYEIPQDLYHKHNVPIIMCRYDVRKRELSWVTNPCLKDIKFFKAMPHYSAFQVLQGFVGGVLRSSENETIEVSDRSKIEGHGMDYKWSFRKQKDDPR